MSKTVLIVDDEQPLRKMIERILKKKGLTFQHASSHDEAVEILKKEDVHVCITDIAMPEKTGVQLMKTIRETLGLTDLPVIVLSGFAERTQKEVMAWKPSAIYQKPFKPEDLRWAVDQALEEHA